MDSCNWIAWLLSGYSSMFYFPFLFQFFRMRMCCVKPHLNNTIRPVDNQTELPHTEYCQIKPTSSRMAFGQLFIIRCETVCWFKADECKLDSCNFRRHAKLCIKKKVLLQKVVDTVLKKTYGSTCKVTVKIRRFLGRAANSEVYPWWNSRHKKEHVWLYRFSRATMPLVGDVRGVRPPITNVLYHAMWHNLPHVVNKATQLLFFF